MVEIQDASYDDIDDVAALWVEFMDSQRRFDDKFINSPENIAKFKDFVNEKMSEGHCLKAVEREKTVGYLLMGMDRNPLDIKYSLSVINDVYVTPSARGKGVGSALMEKALEKLTREGYDTVRLFVYSKNEDARSLYDKFGFKCQMNILARPLK